LIKGDLKSRPKISEISVAKAIIQIEIKKK
jgi:hypothetical protein